MMDVFKNNFDAIDNVSASRLQSSDDLAKSIMTRFKPEEVSFGTVGFNTKRGAHAVSWEMKDGKIRFFDSWARVQTSKGIEIIHIEDCSNYFPTQCDTKYGATITRIDNLEIDSTQHLKKKCSNFNEFKS